MKKTFFRNLVIVGALGLTFGMAWAADQIVPEGKITLEGKRPVNFSHKPHIELGITCGECHHDADHQPLTAEKIGAMTDTRQLKCAGCHDENFTDKKLRTDKEIFHTNCRGCHSIGVNGKNGPMACGSCHVRKQRKRTMIEGC